ncbi:uncharacterized protein LOC132649481 isoform X2 [Meriones unguiculatus]|uniref:uncharacterized protein LOC132649481 isoform X2 n=1 Tax=Meriones unguiculatus TaxID=10047 RepID=UPI00293F098A|nr:uncharacterized protein LOC132649481 isoform X2 [Meriones unguiculatus]
MDKPATAALSRPQNLSLLVLLSYLMTTLSAEAAAVCCVFTVGRSGSGPWHYEVQVLLNEGTVKCHATDDLRNRVNQTLNGEVCLFKDVLNQVRQEEKITKGSTSKAPNITQVIPATPPPPTTPIQNTTNTKILGSLGAVVALLAIGIGVRAKIHKKRFYQDVRSHMGSHLVLGASPCCRSDHESNGNSVSTAASWTSLEQYPSLLPHSQKRKPSDGVGDL